MEQTPGSDPRPHPPVIHRIEWGAGCIRVQAIDNIGVTQVWVIVLDENGKLLETGDAIRVKGDWWEYAPRVEGKRILPRPSTCPGTVPGWK